MEAPTENLKGRRFYHVSKAKLFRPDSIITVFGTPEEAIMSLFHAGRQEDLSTTETYYILVFYVKDDLMVDSTNYDYDSLDPQTCVDNSIIKAALPVVIKRWGNDAILGSSIASEPASIQAYVICGMQWLTIIRSATINLSSLIMNVMLGLKQESEKTGYNVETMLEVIKDLLVRAADTYIDIEDPSLLLETAMPRSPQQYQGEDQFQRLPKDIIIYMALDMNIETIGRLCGSSRPFNDVICNNDEFQKRQRETQ